MQLERDASKFLILALYGAIIADVLTHGSVAIAIGNIIGGIIRSSLAVAAGQKLPSR
jgi:hypothetical protein